jgi:uncharacterized membrane protein (Fun14 family)
MTTVSHSESHRQSLPAHLRTMPRWHRVVLLIAVLLAAAGSVGWAVTRTAPGERRVIPPTPAAASAAAPSVSKSLAPRSGFVDERTTTVATPLPADAVADANDTTPGGWISRLSPHATGVGVSVVAGFLMGWLFRAFLKTMTFFALIVAGLLAALSYFGVLNVDMTAARGHYGDAVHWLTDQAMRLKDVIVAHLPSSGGGAFGAFMGFRRR